MRRLKDAELDSLDNLQIDWIQHADALELIRSHIADANAALDAVSVSWIWTADSYLCRAGKPRCFVDVYRDLETHADDLAWHAVDRASPSDRHPHGCADMARQIAIAAVAMRAAISWLCTAAQMDEG